MLKFVSMMDIQGRELCFHDFIKNMFKIGLCLNVLLACVQKLGTDFFQTWFDNRHN